MEKTCIWKLKRKKEIRQKVQLFIFCLICYSIGIFGVAYGCEKTFGSEKKSPSEMMDCQLYKVECTAYTNENGNLTASGKKTVEGLTIAGAREWIGCTCAMYDEDMNFLGFYEFQDTGYGKNGDIQRGETVDLYFDTKEKAKEWGRKKVFIQIIPSVG